MCVIEVNSISQAAEFRGAWDSLMASVPHASFFQSFEWLQCHWKYVGQDRKLRIFFVLNHDQPIGLFALNVVREQTRLGMARTLTVPLDGWGSTYGPLGERPDETMRAVLAHLSASPPDFDLIDLRWQPPLEGEFGEATLEPAEGTALIELDRPWGDYWESRRQYSNRRRAVERCERRLNEQGVVRHVRYRPLGKEQADGDPRWELYDACELLAGKSWQAGLIEGNTLSHECVREFLRDVHAAAAECGALDLNLLYLEDRPIAFAYGFHYRGYVDVMRIGFDPDLAKLGPGNALWTRLIRDSIERGDRLLDLGPTCLDYKELWLTGMRPSFRLTQYTHSPRAQTLRLARWVRSQLFPSREQTNAQSKDEVRRNSASAHAEEIADKHPATG